MHDENFCLFSWLIKPVTTFDAERKSRLVLSRRAEDWRASSSTRRLVRPEASFLSEETSSFVFTHFPSVIPRSYPCTFLDVAFYLSSHFSFHASSLTAVRNSELHKFNRPRKLLTKRFSLYAHSPSSSSSCPSLSSFSCTYSLERMQLCTSWCYFGKQTSRSPPVPRLLF